MMEEPIAVESDLPMEQTLVIKYSYDVSKRAYVARLDNVPELIGTGFTRSRALLALLSALRKWIFEDISPIRLQSPDRQVSGSNRRSRIANS